MEQGITTYLNGDFKLPKKYVSLNFGQNLQESEELSACIR